MARAKPANETQPPKSQPPEDASTDGLELEEDDLDDEEEAESFEVGPSRLRGTLIGRTMSRGASYQGNEPLLIARPTERDGSGSGGTSTAWAPRRTMARPSSPRDRGLTIDGPPRA